MEAPPHLGAPTLGGPVGYLKWAKKRRKGLLVTSHWSPVTSLRTFATLSTFLHISSCSPYSSLTLVPFPTFSQCFTTFHYVSLLFLLEFQEKVEQAGER